jgi:UDP-N-acetylglucosamine 2-epimerase (non-hydrolysing)
MARALRGPLASLRPSLVVVVGDVDSTVAGAEAAADLGVPIAHVEAGLRSFEPSLPEERNRVRVDRRSDLLHTTEPSGAENLRREGIPERRIRRSGDVLADALAQFRPRIDAHRRRRRRERGPYVVATLHRQANVDDASRLRRFADAFSRIARDVPVLFPVHPRTAKRLGAAGRRSLLRRGVRVVPPLAYAPFLAAVADADAVVTDSGGLAVETSLLGVPCVTARRRTEHLLTLTHGTNLLAGARPEALPRRLAEALERPTAARARPPDWDGRAAVRCVEAWVRMTT